MEWPQERHQMNNKSKVFMIAFVFMFIVTVFLIVYTIYAPTAQIQVPKHKIADYTQNQPFIITEIKNNKGIQLDKGDIFSYNNENDLPIYVEGITTLNSTNNIWTVLQDTYGDYYLQNPPVAIHESTHHWEASNIRPLKDIKYIYFYLVNTTIDLNFKQRVLDDNWRAFKELPPGLRDIGYIELRNQYDAVYTTSINHMELIVSVFFVEFIKILASIFTIVIGIITLYTKAHNQHMDNAKDCFGKGNALFIKGEYDLAIIAYEEAIRIDTNYGEAWYYKGIALKQLGQNKDAATAFDKAKALGYKG
jgi:tetratricopeptide (TPR) repeat protein